MKKTLFTLLFAIPLALSALPAAAGKNVPALDKAHTAVLITDPQNEFLREDGKLYGAGREPEGTGYHRQH